MAQPDDLSAISGAIRALVEEAQRRGASVKQVAKWSKATVVHMATPMPDDMRRVLEASFPTLRYFRTDGDPHNPPVEGFFDDATATAISFPRPKGRV